MFLVRTAFWLSLVIAFIPVNPEDLRDGQRPVSTGETISAIQAVVADLSGFCDRNPVTCGTGRELFAQMGAKAKNGAKLVHDYLDSEATDGMATGSLERE